jgi:hypothetical protein
VGIQYRIDFTIINTSIVLEINYKQYYKYNEIIKKKREKKEKSGGNGRRRRRRKR